MYGMWCGWNDGSVTNSFMTSIGIGSLYSPNYGECQYPSALEYDSFDVGEAEPRQCVKHALWFLMHGSQPMALLWTSETSHSGCGFQTKLRLDVANVKSTNSDAVAQDFFRHLERTIGEATTYRGKILSLESNSDYRGHSGGIVVHQLKTVPRDDVILPESTVRLLERNAIRFVNQRPELAKLGMPTKKGLLLYGPPGTGKTYTIHYLIGALSGHTTLLVTAEQVGLLDEYITLARLLQPSVLVLEDVDLIGRERNGMEVGRESLLNKLLNEMDGLHDAEILFLMTTNRPEALESTLAARPDESTRPSSSHFPDEAGRQKLIRLYAAGAAVSDEVVAHTARITEGVSLPSLRSSYGAGFPVSPRMPPNGAEIRVLQNDVDQAIDELLYAGGSLNRTLLGADRSDSSNE